MKRIIFSIALYIFCTAFSWSKPAAPLSEPVQTDLFVAGEAGYHTYRIPSLLLTKKGSLLAFCEGRKFSASDTGDIDLLCKRSTDGGKTWGKVQMLWDDGPNTCGNPCPVVDARTGIIYLLLTHNLGIDHEKEIKTRSARGTRTVWLSKSKDDGKTWSRPEEITSETKNPEWNWYATGPGVGIQIQHGPHKGRLVIPCNHSVNQPDNGTIDPRNSHVIYSDDHGNHWKIGAPIGPKMNESQVVELAENGNLLIDMRSYFGHSRRAQSISRDGGQTWTEPRDHPDLIEPICQASILRYTWPEREKPGRILFSNPADETRRRNLTIRLSYNDGGTWAVSRQLNAGPSAYSCLGILPDKSIACLYERGEVQANEKVTFARFSLEWLTDGKDAIFSTKK